ncbi:MAG: beta-galactosidase trimerization domain-containing protein [bacterium]
MKKYLIILSVVAVGIIAYALIPVLSGRGKIYTTNNESRMLPKVLFLTTGVEDGNGELSLGVITAIQSFNKRGAFVWLDNRDVLLQPDVLAKYSVMIIPTSIGYHDGDKKYSLTFLSDAEMENISNWVRNGGTLIAEENIGRNTMDEADRAYLNGELNPATWKLSEVFGIKMKERDMDGFSIEEKDVRIWNGRVREPIDENEWVLIPSEIISDKVKVLAEWKNGEEKIPAIIQNNFGKGKAFLLTSTYLLHPSNDGGVSGIQQIENFYNYVLDGYSQDNKIRCELSPWPNGNTSAFCISFNSLGDAEKYNTVVNFLKAGNIPATFFIDSSLTDEQKKILQNDERNSLQSGLYSPKNYSTANYPEISRQIILNEQKFNEHFTGIRFPYNSPNFWGLIYADGKGYIFDTSIGVDHLKGYTGSVFPYNIPVSKDSYYKTLHLLELCPVKNDDRFYFERSETENDYSGDMERNDAQLFEKYLLDFFEHAVNKYNGIMIYQGQPQYTGLSENSLRPLKNLTDTLRTKNCWITSLDEVAKYRNDLRDLSVGISESDNAAGLKISLPDQTVIHGLTFRFIEKPDRVDAKNKYDLKEMNGLNYLITDVRNGDEILITFK